MPFEILEKAEVRYYKGKYKVQICIKGMRSKGKGPITYRVQALEEIPERLPDYILKDLKHINREVVWHVGEFFTTVPRLLWRKKRLLVNQRIACNNPEVSK